MAKYKVIKPIKPKKRNRKIKIWQIYSGEWIAAYDDDPNGDNELATGGNKRQVFFKLKQLGLDSLVEHKEIKMEELLKKLDILIISETRVKGETIKGMRPIQFMKWWGDFRPGDRVDVMFDEEYISMAGTNAEGHFAGIKKELDIDDPTEMAEFRNAEGNLWNFV